jgi:hypothetical protein
MKQIPKSKFNLTELMEQDIDTQKDRKKTLLKEKNSYSKKLELFKQAFTETSEKKSQSLAEMKNHFEQVLSKLIIKQNKIESKVNLQTKQLNEALEKQRLACNWILRLINKIMGIAQIVKNLSAELSKNSKQNDEYSDIISLYQQELVSVTKQIADVDKHTCETDAEYLKIYQEFNLCENNITSISNKIVEIRLNNLSKALEKFEKSIQLHKPLSAISHTAIEYNSLLNTVTKKINNLKEIILKNPDEETISNIESDQPSMEDSLQKLKELHDKFEKEIQINENEVRINSIHELEAINADIVELDRIRSIIFQHAKNDDNFFQHIWFPELAKQYACAKDYADKATLILNDKKLNISDFSNTNLLFKTALTNFNRILIEKSKQYPQFAEKIIVKEENNFAISNRIVKITQGQTGDCLLLSFLNNYIDTKIKRIEDIKQLITINTDGSVEISFPDNHSKLPEKIIAELTFRGYEVQKSSSTLKVKINAKKAEEINDNNKYSTVKLAQSGHAKEEKLYQQYFRCCEAFLGSIYRSEDKMKSYDSQIVYEQHVSNRAKWVGEIFGYKIQECVDGFDAISKYIKNNKFNHDTISVLGMRDEQDFAKNAQYEEFSGHAWAVRNLDTENRLRTINPWGKEEIFDKSSLIKRRPHLFVYVKQ